MLHLLFTKPYDSAPKLFFCFAQAVQPLGQGQRNYGFREFWKVCGVGIPGTRRALLFNSQGGVMLRRRLASFKKTPMMLYVPAWALLTAAMDPSAS